MTRIKILIYKLLEIYIHSEYSNIFLSTHCLVKSIISIIKTNIRNQKQLSKWNCEFHTKTVEIMQNFYVKLIFQCKIFYHHQFQYYECFLIISRKILLSISNTLIRNISLRLELCCIYILSSFWFVHCCIYVSNYMSLISYFVWNSKIASRVFYLINIGIHLILNVEKLSIVRMNITFDFIVIVCGVHPINFC